MNEIKSWWNWQLPTQLWPGHHPTSDNSIKCEIRPKFEVILFKIYSTNNNEILHMSQQWHYCDICKILLWSVDQVLNYSNPNFDRILNLIPICSILFVGQWPVAYFTMEVYRLAGWLVGWLNRFIIYRANIAGAPNTDLPFLPCFCSHRHSKLVAFKGFDHKIKIWNSLWHKLNDINWITKTYFAYINARF